MLGVSSPPLLPTVGHDGARGPRTAQNSRNYSLGSMGLRLHLLLSCPHDPGAQFKQLIDFLSANIKMFPPTTNTYTQKHSLPFFGEAFRVLLPDVTVCLVLATCPLLTPLMLRKESLERLASSPAFSVSTRLTDITLKRRSLSHPRPHPAAHALSPGNRRSGVEHAVDEFQSQFILPSPLGRAGAPHASR